MRSARQRRKTQELQETPQATPDESLASRAAGGDRNAFNLLILRHKDALYRFVRRYTGDPDDAYDVLQDTFVSAWAGLRRYDCERPFRPWLQTIALNKCRDLARRQRVRRALLPFGTQGTSEAAAFHAESAEREARMSARIAQLDSAIAALPPAYKEPLLLTVFEGLTHDEAAKILKTTRKAVEMRIYRARQQLAAKIGREDEK